MMEPRMRQIATALPLAALLAGVLVGGCGSKSDQANAPAPASPAPTAPSATPSNPPGPAADATVPGGPGGTMMNKPSANPNGAAGDAVITAKVKSAIIADTKVGAKDVNVDTKSGVVVLRGNVKSAAAKAAAAADAKKMQGVTKVVDQLTVNAAM